MTTHKLDPDVERWGLHLLDGCILANDSSRCTVTGFDRDLSNVEYVSEGFADPFPSYTTENNPEAVPRAYQENLLEGLQASAALPEGWLGSLGRNENGNDWKIENSYGSKVDNGDLGNKEASTVIKVNGENSNGETDRDNGNAENHLGGIYTYGLSGESTGENAMNGQDLSYLLEITDEYSLDSELGRRLNDMVPVPHVPKTVENIPSIDEAVSDHERLLERLQLYFLVEHKVQGDGNCQFRALSDQLYRSGEHHGFVRGQIVQQLKGHPEIYAGYVPMSYADYLRKMNKSGEWGDHVTLQAAADWYGVKIFMITSFKDTCSIEILPNSQKSNRVIFLSFWAEVHYNSIYPEGELPELCMKKKKKKWWDNILN